MAAVSSLGIGSGLDLNTLLSGIKSAEQAPLNALQKQQTSYTTQLTAYGQLSRAPLRARRPPASLGEQRAPTRSQETWSPVCSSQSLAA